MKLNRLLLAFGVLAPLIAANTVSASTVFANFGAFNSTPEPGYTNVVPLTAVTNTIVLAATDSLTFTTPVVGGVTITATSATVGGGAIADNRLRAFTRQLTAGDFTGPLGILTAGFIGTQRGFLAADATDLVNNPSGLSRASSLIVGLSGVTAGDHTWTSYHLDNGIGAAGNQSGQMRIEFSNNAGATFTTLATNFQVTDSEAVGTPLNANPFTHTFTATGADILFRFTNVALGSNAAGAPASAEDFTVINGFNLVPVPEPSSALLGLVGALTLLRRRRR
jgi:hypothetical protein